MELLTATSDVFTVLAIVFRPRRVKDGIGWLMIAYAVVGVSADFSKPSLQAGNSIDQHSQQWDEKEGEVVAVSAASREKLGGDQVQVAGGDNGHAANP